MICVREVDHVYAALIPALNHHVAARHRNEAAIVRNAVLLRRLRGGDLEVRVLRVLVILADRERRVAAHLHHAVRLAHRSRAAAPFVREDDLPAIIAEHGRVPALEVRVRLRGKAHRLFGVRDVHEQSMAQARAGQEVQCRVGRHVVAVARSGRLQRRRARRSATAAHRRTSGGECRRASRPVKIRAPGITLAFSG